MKYRLVRAELFPPFELTDERVNILVIERPSELYSFALELDGQLNGEDGGIVLSSGDKPLRLSAKAELFTRFVPFEINTKRLVTKLHSYFEKKSQQPEFYNAGIEFQTAVNDYLRRLTGGDMIECEYGEIEPAALFKAVNMRLCEDSESLEDKLIDCLNYIRELDSDKVFIFLNLLSYINPARQELFFRTLTDHGFCVLFVESRPALKSPLVNQMIIDEDLCII